MRIPLFGCRRPAKPMRVRVDLSVAWPAGVSDGTVRLRSASMEPGARFLPIMVYPDFP